MKITVGYYLGMTELLKEKIGQEIDFAFETVSCKATLISIDVDNESLTLEVPDDLASSPEIQQMIGKKFTVDIA